MKCLAALLLVTTASTALAQGTAEDRARTLFDRGMIALEAFRFGEARALFEESLHEYVEPGAAFNLGLALRGAGESILAIEQWTALLNGNYGDLSEGQRAQVEVLVREERLALAHLEARVGANEPRVELRVRIDGRDQESLTSGGRTFYVLDPGRHILTARAPGFEVIEETIELTPGERAQIELSLVARAETTSTPIWRRGWFWGVVGGIVLVGVAAAILVAAGPYYESVNGAQPLGVVETP